VTQGNDMHTLASHYVDQNVPASNLINTLFQPISNYSWCVTDNFAINLEV
jgi:hypothetical protein